MKDKRIALKVIVVCLIAAVMMMLGACSNGLSAYDIAVENGFVGTETEWLESLKGKDGENLDIDALYAKYLEVYPGKTYDDFLNSFNIELITAQTAISKALCSTVSIISTFQKTVKPPFGAAVTQDYYAAGSGVIYDINDDKNAAYIITNYHVVYDLDSTTTNHLAKDIQVNNYARQGSADSVTAEFIGGSIYNDIAIIKISGATFFTDSSVSEAAIADSNLIGVGEAAYVAGNPAALGISATAGIISVDSENIEMEALDNAKNINIMRVIRVDAAINGGNSGGGLYNAKGELIGIVNAKIVDESIESIGYAIPSNVAAAIAESYIRGDGKKSVIGITTVSEYSKTVYANSKISLYESVKVYSVTSGSLADSAGFTAGDILTKATLGDSSTARLELDITRSFYLSDFLLKALKNETLKVSVLRNGTPITLTVILDESKRVVF